jgi:hypothetical protein
MAWIEREPDTVVPVADAERLVRTPACAVLVRGYAKLIGAAGDHIPAKNDLDITDVARMLRDAALCAVTLPDRCVYRVAGEQLKTRLGFNPTGLNYYSLVPEIRRPYAARAMNMVVTVPCGFRAEIEQRSVSGEIVAVEAVAFPLRSEEPGVDGFIIFGDQAITPKQTQPGRTDPMLGANVVHRDLIDLGFGVDSTFRDLVQVPD